MISHQDNSAARPLDWLIFVFVPIFFSSNLIFGRGVIGDIAPFLTAFIRWAGATLIILPFVYADRKACVAFVRDHFFLWLTLGFLGMGICGGFVYWALTRTTASNATLIYTTSSLFIILFQWMIFSRPISAREIAGMAIAFAGVSAIVLQGDLSAIFHMSFNLGDLGILIAAVAFAIYSLMLRNPAVKSMAPLSLFSLISASGAAVLLPFALYELFTGGPMPDSGNDWLKIAGIILFASLAAFYCFQHVVGVFGPTVAGITLYLMPPVSIVMAVIFLGETFESYHAMGIVLVMGGVILASAPKIGLRRRPPI